MSRKLGAHAIVIGSGIAGLCTAQVLCRYFNEVTVIERGEKPHSYQPRKEVPQGFHLHALLKGGELALELLFPGITQVMLRDGSTLINGTKDLQWFHHGVWKKRFAGEVSVLLQSRPFLEGHIRHQVEQNQNLRFLYKTTALEPIFDESRNIISGIQVKDDDAPQPAVLYADLVVDAGGNGSKLHQWFASKGYRCPADKVTINLSYVSQIYQLDDAVQRDWSTLLVYPSPPSENIGGAISRIEGNRHIVTLIGYDYPLAQTAARDSQSFVSFTKRLPQETIYNELKGSRPLSDIKAYQIPQIIRYRYDKAKEFPQRFLFIGDALCRFDPVFGQGMSVAAMEALQLEDCLQQEWKERNSISAHFMKRYYQKVSKVIDPVWQIILIEDFRYQHVTGKKLAGLAFLQWYTRRIFVRSSQNTEIYQAFIYVMNLLRPAATLFSPSILYRTLRRK